MGMEGARNSNRLVMPLFPASGQSVALPAASMSRGVVPTFAPAAAPASRLYPSAVWFVTAAER
jgi:hypothetical protein